jgi:ATPase subunit of ABC transporter with duplicated ATPase domains
MAAPSGDRVLWADSISQTYDGDHYQFKNITLSVQFGAKIAVLGGNGGAWLRLRRLCAAHLSIVLY